MGSARRTRRPLPPKKCVSLPNKGGQIKSTRQKWGQRSLPLDRTERCRSLGGAWVPRPDGRPALKNSLDYTAASIGSQCCILAEIFTLFRRFIGWKIENAKVEKIFLAIRWEMRYDRVGPPCGGLLFLAKKSPPAAALGYRGNVIYRSIRSKFFCAFRQLRAVIPTKSSTPAASTISCIPKPSVWEFIAAMPGK